eukprot:scpid50951/ scgid29516/ Pumilio domain-containing protein KIAA0020 homolog
MAKPGASKQGKKHSKASGKKDGGKKDASKSPRKSAGKKDFSKSGKKPSKHTKSPAKKDSSKSAAGKKPLKDDKAAAVPAEPAKKMHELSRKERRDVRRSDKDHSDLRTSAIKLWEKLRRHDLIDETRPRILAELGQLLKGNMLKLIMKHDTARVVESYLKFGSKDERDVVFKELNGHWVKLVQSKYAKFAVKRIFKYGTRQQCSAIVKSFFGYTRHLIKSKEAASVLETAYVMHSNAAERAALVSEFYGPQYSLTKGAETRPLSKVLEEDPSKRQSIVQHLKDSLVPLAEKQPMQHSLVHKALLDFFTYATGEMRTEMIEAVRESLVHIVHTKEGAQVTMHCLWHGTAKDRKVIVKTFKSFVKKISMEEYGHGVMLALFDTVDDTTLVSKALISEIAEGLEDLAGDRFGRKVLHYLLESRGRSQCHPTMTELLRHGDGNPNSKKPAELRCKELRATISASLLQHCAANAVEMARNKPQSQLLLATTDHIIGDVRPILDTMAAAVVVEYNEEHICADESGHFCVKKLVLQDKNRPDGPHFSQILLEQLPKGFAFHWSQTNRGAFVVSSFLECGVDSSSKRIRSELSSRLAELRRLQTPGTTVLCKLLEKDAG